MEPEGLEHLFAFIILFFIFAWAGLYFTLPNKPNNPED